MATLWADTLNRHAIRTRILAAFALALIAMTATLAYGTRQMQAIGHELEAVNSGLLPISKVSVELGALVSQLDRDHDRFARPGSAKDAGRKANATLYRNSIKDVLARGMLTAARAQRSVHHPEDAEVLEKLHAVFLEMEQQSAGYTIAVSGWFEASEADDTATSSRMLADLDRRRQGLAAGADLAQGLVEGQIERVSRRTARAQHDALIISVALGILCLVLSAALAGVALRALRPIGTLIGQVQRVAAGDLTGRIELDTKDEMGVLAAEFNTMADAVSERDQALLERALSLEELQSRLRQILDTITSGLVVIIDGRIETINPAAAQLWGVESGAPAPPWMTALDDGAHDQLTVDKAMYALSLVPFGSEGTLIVGEDITEREAVRERLMRSERLALVGRMLAQITHEVRNPLNAMSLNADMLSDEVDSPDAKVMLDTISSEIRRLEGLTERYLHLSRKRVSERLLTDPKEMVNSLLAMDEGALSQAGLSVMLSGVELSPLEFDSDAVTRAIRNLLRNAAEAGAKQVQIDVNSAGEWLYFALTDDGPGMDAEQTDQAFDPFFTTKVRGTGLGLAISRQEIEEIGGTLIHDAAHTRGARFVLSIPISA